MKIIRDTPKLELTEREYRLLDDAYTLIAAIDAQITDDDWDDYLFSAFEDASLADAKSAIGALMDWSKYGLK